MKNINNLFNDSAKAGAISFACDCCMRYTSCVECDYGTDDGPKGIWCRKFHSHYDPSDGCNKGSEDKYFWDK